MQARHASHLGAHELISTATTATLMLITMQKYAGNGYGFSFFWLAMFQQAEQPNALAGGQPPLYNQIKGFEGRVHSKVKSKSLRRSNQQALRKDQAPAL